MTKTIQYGYLMREQANSLHGNRNYGGRSKTIHAIVNGNPICSPRDVGLPSEKKTAADVTCSRCRERMQTGEGEA
jgi:hypothetical protein